jgi:hypothetical protein
LEDFMNRPESFKFDTRIRERLLKNGMVALEDVTKHVEALVDLADQLETITLEQPALAAVKEPEPPPAAGILGLGVPALTALEPAPRVNALEPGLLGLRGGLGPAPKVSPFEPANASGLDGAKVNPFEPAPLVSPYEPAPRVSPYSAGAAADPAPKVNPFEGGKISPFEPSFGMDAQVPSRPPVPAPQVAPPVPVYSPPPYTPPQSPLHAQPPLSPHAPIGQSPLGQSPLGPGAPLVSPFEPSTLVSPFDPAPRVPPVTSPLPDGRNDPGRKDG